MPPPGRLGAEDGAASRFLLRRAGETTTWSGVEDTAGNPSKFSNLIMEAGDSLRVENGGGGGFGPPGERDPGELAIRLRRRRRDRDAARRQSGRDSPGGAGAAAGRPPG